ncbi:FkbM family methyltransferase [Williamsia serinedens]|uniref:Methyltransferase, FkbM family n=1 Tax=Williamsia serinedens TaxID=391736 RepID=A0ABT1H439_9NOCA|nr:FkbM family methyltransferase [Williamsia serinedens]MCP2161911.1 methyltransferase, FkbM family [Williamsia serinedens]
MNKASKLLRILRVPEYRTALQRHRVAAAVEHAAVLSALDVSSVVDVGGNRGQFALFATHAFPSATITSFEPLAGPAGTFAALFREHSRVTLHQVALGAEAGSATMHVSGHDDSSSLLPISDHQNELFPGTAEVATEAVTVGVLADFVDTASFDGPALLKLDVQGFELEVLRGCESELGSFDYVCAEGSFTELYEGQALAPQIIDWLDDRGFSLTTVYGPVADDIGRLIQADMLFTARDRLS